MKSILFLFTCVLTTSNYQEKLLNHIKTYSINDDISGIEIVNRYEEINKAWYNIFESHFLHSEIRKNNIFYRTLKCFPGINRIHQLFCIPMNDEIFEKSLFENKFHEELKRFISSEEVKMNEKHNKIIKEFSFSKTEKSDFFSKITKFAVSLNAILIELFHLIPVLNFYHEGIPECKDRSSYKYIEEIIVNYNYKSIEYFISEDFSSFIDFVPKNNFLGLYFSLVELHRHTKLLLDHIIKYSKPDTRNKIFYYFC